MQKISWKIYAIIYVLLTIAGFFMVINSIASWNFGSWEGVLESIVLAIGVFVFAYDKNFLNNLTWKVIFVAILIIWIIDAVSATTNLPYIQFLKPNIDSNSTNILVSIIISIPALVSIYKLGLSKNKN